MFKDYILLNTMEKGYNGDNEMDDKNDIKRYVLEYVSHILNDEGKKVNSENPLINEDISVKVRLLRKLTNEKFKYLLLKIEEHREDVCKDLSKVPELETIIQIYNEKIDKRIDKIQESQKKEDRANAGLVQAEADARQFRLERSFLSLEERLSTKKEDRANDRLAQASVDARQFRLEKSFVSLDERLSTIEKNAALSSHNCSILSDKRFEVKLCEKNEHGDEIAKLQKSVEELYSFFREADMHDTEDLNDRFVENHQALLSLLWWLAGCGGLGERFYPGPPLESAMLSVEKFAKEGVAANLTGEWRRKPYKPLQRRTPVQMEDIFEKARKMKTPETKDLCEMGFVNVVKKNTGVLKTNTSSINFISRLMKCLVFFV